MLIVDGIHASLEVAVECIKCGIISIDGCCGVGKTTLASSLANAFGGAAIDLDNFLNRNANCFAAAVRLNELGSSLKCINEKIFLSGICMQDILSRLHLRPALKIYVERVSACGVPQNLDIVDAEADIFACGLSSSSAIERELANYHAKFMPRRLADVIFQVRED